MSSSGLEDLLPHGRFMRTREGSILTDRASIREYTCNGGRYPVRAPTVVGATPPARLGGPLMGNSPSPVRDPAVVGDLNHQGHTEVDQLPTWRYTPRPGAECRRTTIIQLDCSKCTMMPPDGVSYIFVQGKESACIVARDLGKGKGKGHNTDDLLMDFIGWAGIGRRRISILVDASQLPADMFTFAVVSVLLNPDDLNCEKESRPGSSHKDSTSRGVDEQAAINFLKQKLENYTSEETIQTAIYALQCLYQESIKADEIEVYTAQGDGIGDFLPREEIKVHLAVINNGTSIC